MKIHYSSTFDTWHNGARL